MTSLNIWVIMSDRGLKFPLNNNNINIESNTNQSIKYGESFQIFQSVQITYNSNTKYITSDDQNNVCKLLN